MEIFRDNVLGTIEEELNKSGFLVGNSMTLADLAIFNEVLNTCEIASL